MDPLISTFLIFVLMAAVVAAFRLWVRAPRGRSCYDPPGVRTVAIFSGEAPEFFRDDREDGMLVGVRLFGLLCDGLAARGILVENRGPVENAQGAECVVQNERFGLVLERVEEHWAASVEWLPASRAERRHMALTHQVFSPSDTPALRRLLSVLDGWLKSHPQLSHVGWHRKEDFLSETTGEPASGPMEEEGR